MKCSPLLCVGLFFASVVSVFFGAGPASAQANSKPSAGNISGQVRDAAGTPQLGATVEVLSETAGLNITEHFLTNTQGVFQGDKLAPGLYTVRVTLAGFLPSLEKHVRISANLTTMVRIELESMFASLEQMRRSPATASVEADDWKWALRSASGLRPVLQWNDDDSSIYSAIVMENAAARPKGRLELMDGARHPGSVANIGQAPATAFAYDQHIDKFNHIVFAGAVSYDEDSPSGGIAAIWLPNGSIGSGPTSTIVLREARIGENGPTFRAGRLEQGGTITFGDRVLLRVGGEYVVMGLQELAWSVRPRMNLETKISPNWYLDLTYATVPNASVVGAALAADLESPQTPNVLETALSQLDAFPTLLWRNGRPVLENAQHAEVAVERKLGSRGTLQVAGFHDNDRHIAVYGRGPDQLSSDYFQDFSSKGFAYDGGASSAWGARVALRERITEDLELTTIYAFSGALIPANDLDGALRNALRSAPRESLAAKVTATIPRSNTRVSAGYKWVNGAALSRVDGYGEAIYQLSPYFNVAIRQPLPKTVLGRWEATAECDNILGQGYYTMNTGDGPMVITPAARSFWGGLSLQF
ncbi:MAG TPA: TonB-dependent receptor [Candidatus Acidoferrum sp.]|nr:TonB-dependent receptor [Candidatus Acidoferrum sp.]